MDCKLVRRDGAYIFECRTCHQTYFTYDYFKVHTHWDLVKTEPDEFVAHGAIYMRDRFEPTIKQTEFKCDLCPKVFKTKGHLNRHKERVPHEIKTEPEIEEHCCDLCPSVFKSKGNLKRHRTHHFDPQEQCPHCDKRYHEEYTLKQHIFSVHRHQKDFFCPHCSYATSNKHTLRLHVIRKHTKNYPLMCDICGKGYTKKYILDMHRKSVHEGVHFVCEDCGKVFKYMAGLKNHRRILHEAIEKERTICPVCGIKYLYLSSHMKVHGEKNVECELCGKRFWKKGDLRVHTLRKHHSEKPFMCDFCGQCFALNFELKGHVKRRHTGDKQFENETERPYDCEICGKRFKKSAPLDDHLKKHSGEKAYPCEICGKKFLSKYYLRNHECSS